MLATKRLSSSLSKGRRILADKSFWELTATDWLGVEIARADVESLNILSVLTTLNTLLHDEYTVRRFCGRVQIAFSGYDNDPRELFEVPEVRLYMLNLDKEFPYWFYFITTFDGGDNLGLISRCLCRWKIISKGYGEYDKNDLELFLIHHFEAMNFIFQKYKLPIEDNEKLSFQVMKCLGLKV